MIPNILLLATENPVIWATKTQTTKFYFAEQRGWHSWSWTPLGITFSPWTPPRKNVIPEGVNGKNVIPGGVHRKNVIPGGVHRKNVIPGIIFFPWSWKKIVFQLHTVTVYSKNRLIYNFIMIVHLNGRPICWFHHIARKKNICSDVFLKRIVWSV